MARVNAGDVLRPRKIWANVNGMPIIFLFILLNLAQAKELQSNGFIMPNAPDWLTRNRAEKIVERMQTALEWTVHKVQVVWYTSEAEFEKAHGLGPHARAVTQKNLNKILLGSKITNQNFDQVFGHELVHLIAYQKYKEGIPRWLEEGLANHLARNGKVDYAFLKRKPLPTNVFDLAHPMRGSYEEILYRYEASQALAEMISKKCDLTNLLRLSVGRNMEDYLKTYCEIPDLNAAFKKWIEKK